MTSFLRRDALAVVGAALLIRALCVWAIGPDPRYSLTPDSPSYLAPAKNLLQHQSFSSSESPPLIPETMRTPGYPIFLAPFCAGGVVHTRAIVWVQVLLGALTAGLLSGMAWMLWWDRRAAWVAGLAQAFDFVTVVHTHFILTETLYVFVFSLALLGLVKAFLDGPKAGGWILLSGLGFGAAALVRPIGLYYFFPAALILAWEWRRRMVPRWIPAVGLFLAMSLLIPVGWMARNKAASGTWTFSSVQGLNFYIVRTAVLEMHRTGKSYEQAMADLETQFKSSHPEGFSSPEEEAAEAGTWSLKYMLEHPVDLAAVSAKDLVRLLAGNSMKVGAWLFLKDERHDPWTIPLHPSGSLREQTKTLVEEHPALGVALALYSLFLVLIYVLALKGFVTCWRSGEHPKAVLVASSAVYIVALTVGAAAHARYRIPAMPALCLLAAAGLLPFNRSSDKAQ